MEARWNATKRTLTVVVHLAQGEAAVDPLARAAEGDPLEASRDAAAPSCAPDAEGAEAAAPITPELSADGDAGAEAEGGEEGSAGAAAAAKKKQKRKKKKKLAATAEGDEAGEEPQSQQEQPQPPQPQQQHLMADDVREEEAPRAAEAAAAAAEEGSEQPAAAGEAGEEEGTPAAGGAPGDGEQGEEGGARGVTQIGREVAQGPLGGPHLHEALAKDRNKDKGEDQWMLKPHNTWALDGVEGAPPPNALPPPRTPCPPLPAHLSRLPRFTHAHRRDPLCRVWRV